MATNTLSEWIEPDTVNLATLQKRYAPLLGLVKNLLGVVPNCDEYLEVWPVGFRTYNLMVPNFLNLPQLLFGIGAPKDLVGLALYASSRASECPYCSAHCCSFALRRGASAESMMGNPTPAQKAVINIAEALGSMPHKLTDSHVSELRKHLKPADAEWIVMGIAMMGFLNKFMDAMGIPLETEAVADSHAIMSPSGWVPGAHYSQDMPEAVQPPKDNLKVYLSVMRLAPGAIKFDRRWLRGVPGSREKARPWLQQETGVNVETLDRLTHDRPRRALAAMIRDNIDSDASALGLYYKFLAGMVFAELANSASSRAHARAMLSTTGETLSEIQLTALQQLASKPTPIDDSGITEATQNLVYVGFSEMEASICLLGRAIAPSPAEISPAMVSLAKRELTQDKCIELVTWMSIQQLLHRLDIYFEVK